VLLRGRASEMYSATRGAKRYFKSLCFQGPLWVTETAYPSLPAHQWDPAYHTDDVSQMAYIRRLVPDMIRGGADAFATVVKLAAHRMNPRGSTGAPRDGMVSGPWTR
jgi:hypothetical protein